MTDSVVPSPSEPGADDDPWTGTAVVVPIRSFGDAKSRLAEVLDAAQRRRFAIGSAEAVVRAAQGLSVLVVSDDDEVVNWAESVGATAHSPGVEGLIPSVTAAVDHLRNSGVGRAVVAHADLPRARDLRLGATAPVVIVPDRHGDGSNVVSVPTDAGFVFCYGPGSFRRHLDEAARLGLAVEVIDDPDLAWDVDEPADIPAEWSARLAPEAEPS